MNTTPEFTLTNNNLNKSNYVQNWCLVSTPKEKGANPNYLVKLTTEQNLVIYFWMTKLGQFLKMSDKKEWDACCWQWNPKPTAVLLPIAQVKNAAKIEAFIKECQENGREVSKTTWDAMIASEKAKEDAIKAEIEKQAKKREAKAKEKVENEKFKQQTQLKIKELRDEVKPTTFGEIFGNLFSVFSSNKTSNKKTNQRKKVA